MNNDIINIIEDYDNPKRLDYLNKCVDGDYVVSSDGEKIYTDEIYILKKMDEDTMYSLYDKEYNLIKLVILCPTGAKFKHNELGEKLYNMYFIIKSIDDACYQIWFKEKTYKEMFSIRVKFIEWLHSKEEVNGDEFIEKSIELGGDKDEVWYS